MYQKNYLGKLWKRKELGLYILEPFKEIYEVVITSVKTSEEETNNPLITIGLHHCSTLSLYLFNLVLDVLIVSIQEEIPKWMFFTDDRVLLDDSKDEINWKQKL